MAVFEIHPGDVDGAGGHLHQVVHIAPVQRKISDLRRRNRGSQLGIFHIHSRGFACDFNHFLGLAKLHFEINVRDGACV